MTTTIEKLARAIAAAEGCENYCETDKKLARAVLTALLEPSEVMVRAGEDAMIYPVDDFIRNQAEPVFAAMIQAVLGEVPK